MKNKISTYTIIEVILFLTVFTIHSSANTFGLLNPEKNGKNSTNKITEETKENRDSLRQSFTKNNSLADQMLVPNDLEISGFIDLNYSFINREDKKINYGQFEIDFSANMIERLSFEAAIALEDGKFVPGAGYLDYHFTGPEEGHGARGAFFTHSGFHLGQFDVPFGKYYEQIPSPSRQISTIPAVVQQSINCLNTFGFNAYTNYSVFNLNGYILNGIDGGYVVGGRIGLFAVENFEIGGSTLNNIKAGAKDDKLIGLDISAHFELMELGSEFIWGDGLIGCDGTDIGTKHFGFYVENKLLTSKLLNLPLDLIIRYGQWKRDQKSPDYLNSIKHFDFTINYNVVKNLIVKMEYHNQSLDYSETKDEYLIQVVLLF